MGETTLEIWSDRVGRLQKSGAFTGILQERNLHISRSEVDN